MILFGEDSLRNAIRHFVAHYHLERNHQGLENRLIMRAETEVAKSEGRKSTTDLNVRSLGGSFGYRNVNLIQ